MFKAPVLALAGILMMSAPAAYAQRGAPVSQGVTSSDLAGQVQQARQLSANLKVEMNRMSSDVSTLTGRIETLEYELQQERDSKEALTTDNEALSSQISGLRSQLSAQDRALKALTARLDNLDPSSADVPTSTSSTGTSTTYPGATTTTRTYSGSPAVTRGATRQVTRDAATTSTDATTTTRSGPKSIVTRSTTTPGVTTTQPSTSTVTRSAESARTTTRVPTSSDEGLPEGSLGSIPATALPGQAGPLFAAAKSKLLRYDLQGAEEGFQAFIDQFGDDPQLGEAHYWLGEALYQQKAYAEAGVAYTTMIRSFPDDQRAPDALVRLARVMRLVGDSEKACLALDTLPKRYPSLSGPTRDLAAVEFTQSGCSAE